MAMSTERWAVVTGVSTRRGRGRIVTGDRGGRVVPFYLLKADSCFPTHNDA